MEKYLKYPYFKPLEEIVDVVCSRTGNRDRSFYRNLVNFYICQVASNMRCTIESPHIGAIPINFYGVSLATSGYGKGYSTNIIVNEVMDGFRKEFTEVVLPFISNHWLEKLADRVSRSKSTDYDDELTKITKEFKALGAFLFSFDSGTLPAMKQLRQKLLMGKIGALSFIADEIGSNIQDSSVKDIIEGFLELFDVGTIGDKLIKSSADNKRNKHIYGRSPANMLLFGTPDKLFDGGNTEKLFRKLLTTGLSRRCFFAFSVKGKRKFSKTPEEIYDELIDTSKKQVLANYSDLFKDLADTMNYNIKLDVAREQGVQIVAYKNRCEQLAQDLPKNESEKKAELEHSYFKVLKLSGAYAFMDGSSEIKSHHINSAIRCGIDSTAIFQKKVVDQDPPHIKLLNYLCEQNNLSTYADMTRDLPFFPKAQYQRNEIFTLAASEGYLKNITIKHYVDNDIDLYSAKALTKTDLSKVILSYSDKISRDYDNIAGDFEDFSKLSQLDDYHWVNHCLDDGKRSESNVIPGFNLVVLDLDSNVDISTVRKVLSNYTYHIHTTKRHTDESQRFRVVLPLSHVVELGDKEYAKFMRNVYEWLPFHVDEQTNQRSRKWATCKGEYISNDGSDLLDAHKFIPHTTKAIALNSTNSKYVNVPNLEKWFLRQVQEGDGRNNTLVKYALVLVDSGMAIGNILSRVQELNSSFSNSLSELEINSTISVTVARSIANRELEGKSNSNYVEDDEPF